MTPRRWIRFCNPDLSDVITKWIGTEDWVLNTDKLAELKKVMHQYLIFFILFVIQRNFRLLVRSLAFDGKGNMLEAGRPLTRLVDVSLHKVERVGVIHLIRLGRKKNCIHL